MLIQMEIHHIKVVIKNTSTYVHLHQHILREKKTSLAYNISQCVDNFDMIIVNQIGVNK